MKTIGLIGGMSWESSIEYYRIINETVREKLGGLHSAKSVMVSVDFAIIEDLQQRGKWEKATQFMLEAARDVERGGADFFLICTNTMHRMAEDVQRGVKIPLLHIADATAEKIREGGLTKVGLLGTRFTMVEDFYKGRLERDHGLEVMIPDEKGMEIVHRVIYEELVLGIIQETSKTKYVKVMQDLVNAGAEGIILGCTEIGLLVSQKDIQVPVFNTTEIHATVAVDMALED